MEKNMSTVHNAISWFIIPTAQLPKAQAFYEAVLGRPMQAEQAGPNPRAVFAFDREQGAGGALMAGPGVAAPSSSGTLVYLNAAPSLDAALQRAVELGADVVLPRTALPPGVGFMAQIKDLEGNVVGLHAMA
jgi:predicted enzyme related to lactoylglutathione lyase